MRALILTFGLLLLLEPLPGLPSATAEDVSPSLLLGLPLSCEPNVDCWIAQYMDDDPSTGELDYECGNRSYNGHNGTDFAIRDRRVMREGVPVVAAADGVVARLRNGMADTGVTDATRNSVAGRECGNGVVLRHGNGWETQYCHMRNDSIVVQIGEHVQSGQKLGLVGLSGLTEFPHVHLTVRHNAAVVDPFIGLSRAKACGSGEHPLWRPDVLQALSYEPFAIYHLGLADRVLTASEARAGLADWPILPSTSPVLAFWVDIFGVRKNDVLTMRIRDPDGRVIAEQRRVLEADKALYFQLIGRKRGSRDWQPGKYKGEAVLLRPTATNGSSFQKRVVQEVELR